jgi:hypothetical protein
MWDELAVPALPGPFHCPNTRYWHLPIVHACFLAMRFPYVRLGGQEGCILRVFHSRVPPEAPTPRTQRTTEPLAQRGGQDVCLEYWGGGYVPSRFVLSPECGERGGPIMCVGEDENCQRADFLFIFSPSKKAKSGQVGGKISCVPPESRPPYRSARPMHDKIQG